MPQTVYKPGDLVEGYRVISELGRGAASIIYLVQDPKTKQVWALKHVEKDDEKSVRFLEQAEQEYLVASKVASAHVRSVDRIIKKKVSLLGGVSELYLVMEHVDGSSCERHPPQKFEDALYIFEQVAEGLAAMHAKGFVHADMKPNNVIVDDKQQAKIIDLGQSCKIGTVKQRIQGTPDYIAPEQVHRRAITPKTDVYNLGAALYWILTQTFIPTALAKGDSLLGSVDDALLAKPKPPSQINPRVPEMLDALIMSCVEVDQDDRPTMDQVHDRLNLIRSKLLAEIEMRKSAVMRAQGGQGSRAGNNGSKSGASGSRSGGSKGLSGVGGAEGSSKSKQPPEPPIDPGPGISSADD